MDFKVKEGMTAKMETIVTNSDTAKNLGSGNLDVFATPAMVALMENVSKSCVELHLPNGYTTVGVEVNIKHIKASPVGVKVKCEAVLNKVEDKKLFFYVEAWDENGMIGKGTHVRYIVDQEKFMKKIKA